MQDFDESQLVTELQEYVTELRHEYDGLRNKTRKLQAQYDRVVTEKEEAQTRLQSTRNAVASLQKKRAELNKEYGDLLEQLAEAERRQKSWTLVLNRTEHNSLRLKQRCDITGQQVKKSEHAVQIAWKMTEQARAKLDAKEQEKREYLVVRPDKWHDSILQTSCC